MEPYVYGIIVLLIVAGITGLIASLINGIKYELREIKTMLSCMMSKEMCKVLREAMEKDIDNIAVIAREKHQS